MLPVGESRVIEGQTLQEFYVGCQRNSDMGSLNQIVTEQRLLRETAAKNLMKCGDVVYRFTVKDGFAQQILLCV